LQTQAAHVIPEVIVVGIEGDALCGAFGLERLPILRQPCCSLLLRECARVKGRLLHSKSQPARCKMRCEATERALSALRESLLAELLLEGCDRCVCELGRMCSNIPLP